VVARAGAGTNTGAAQRGGRVASSSGVQNKQQGGRGIGGPIGAGPRVGLMGKGKGRGGEGEGRALLT